MKSNALLLLLVGCCLNFAAQSQTKTGTDHTKAARIINTEQRQLHSELNGQDYTLYIALPDGYVQGDAEYPVLYLTDANTYFGMMADMTRNLQWGGEMPETIIVGIGYPIDAFATDDERWEKWLAWRMRDLSPTYTAQLDESFAIEGVRSGEADRFLQFLQAELFPFIAENYRVKENDTTYAGFSLGGLFGLYALFQEPALFQRYLIGSPSIWYDDKLIIQSEQTYADAHSDLSAKLFIAVGELEEEVNAGMVRNMLELTSKLKSRNYPGLSLHRTILEGETHMSAPAVCFQRGLRFFFRN
ncbi:alpha/beta hydrolase [Flavilitoribacter nigricans]|uniref:Alpha/beta hydrolase n=1 Tax=Flavilitoribacter nigricans (strain ATCC 23147 / DSM 23189 / NBRC 102662 / NCIMB 1420 / SS-2) TaxID=1122177 RepID=A0A2D0MYZ0_FLAN2|nr:alpha/beta hydrolase-fold protein [Flavilitoribacter nigricans]PHN01390.1 hypothetical protein CRP01_37640 [Flavilitoribacter nigricans DSM 23189 = NBRC 102662]